MAGEGLNDAEKAAELARLESEIATAKYRSACIAAGKPDPVQPAPTAQAYADLMLNPHAMFQLQKTDPARFQSLQNEWLTAIRRTRRGVPVV